MNVNNRTIFSNDNLHILRGLDTQSVDLIYLDPPFNSNRNYSAPIGSEAAGAAFKDTWTLSDVDNAWHGEIADREPALYQAIHTAELTHGRGMKSYLIMMGVRLLEMKRVLKETGSIYLHCDPTASHYLKMLMDSIFGKDNCRNEIIWQRFSAHNDAKNGFAKIHDILLFYAVSSDTKFNKTYEPYQKEYIEKTYRYKDERGRYTTSPLQARSLSGGGYNYIYKGIQDIWKFPLERLKELDETGHIHWPKRGKIPRRKVYLDTAKGIPVKDIITDIKPLTSAHKERVGYPTQKPIALLERIIKASSNEDDIVLDPFCGCATTCIAAERLNRQWIGIDLSEKAVELVKMRLKKELGMFYDVTHRTDIPKRSEKLPNYTTHKHTLYGKQEGTCNGCQTHFPFRNMTVDHIVPQKHGGTDHEDNLQLLCGACNSTKGTGTQAELIAKLKEQGVL